MMTSSHNRVSGDQYRPQTRRGLAVAGVLALVAMSAPAVQAAHTGAVTEGAPSGDVDAAVVGGRTATSNPGAVFLRFPGDTKTARCTGSLVSSEWVLSAKHCELPGQHNGGKIIKLPEIRINSMMSHSGGEVVKAVERHDNPQADTVLFKLERSVSGKTTTLGKQNLSNGDELDIYGWGDTEVVVANDIASKDRPLKVATMKVSNTNVRDNKGGPGIWLKGVDGASNFGDSGGPGISGGRQVGTCSSGTAQLKVSIYSNITQQSAWIQSVLAGNSPAPNPAPTNQPAPRPVPTNTPRPNPFPTNNPAPRPWPTGNPAPRPRPPMITPTWETPQPPAPRPPQRPDGPRWPWPWPWF